MRRCLRGSAPPSVVWTRYAREPRWPEHPARCQYIRAMRSPLRRFGPLICGQRADRWTADHRAHPELPSVAFVDESGLESALKPFVGDCEGVTIVIDQPGVGTEHLALSRTPSDVFSPGALCRPQEAPCRIVCEAVYGRGPILRRYPVLWPLWRGPPIELRCSPSNDFWTVLQRPVLHWLGSLFWIWHICGSY